MYISHFHMFRSIEIKFVILATTSREAEVYRIKCQVKLPEIQFVISQRL